MQDIYIYYIAYISRYSTTTNETRPLRRVWLFASSLQGVKSIEDKSPDFMTIFLMWQFGRK